MTTEPAERAAPGTPDAPDSPSSPGADIVGRHKGLGRRTIWISLLTLASRVFGFVREIISAYLFGDRSPIYDAFITAWRVPNLFRRFLGEGAMSTSLQQAITAADGDRGDAAGARIFVQTMRLMSWILICVCGAVMLGAWMLPDTMPLTGFAWLGADPQPVRELTVRLMPFVVLICLSALVGGALNVRGHYTTPYLAPVVLNVAWIGALVVVAWRFGTEGATEGATEAAGDAVRHLHMARLLAWGVLAAGVLQLLVQVPSLFAKGLIRRPDSATPDIARPEGSARSEAWVVLRKSAPLAFGAAIYQVNVMLDGLMAEGLLPDGAPTAHYYANRVQQFPLALISIAATSAIFPTLTALGHRGERGELRKLHDSTQRAVCFLALPAAVGLFVLAEVVVAVCFEHGAFGPEGVTRTTAALRALTLAILPAGAVGLVARTYYSLGDMATPVRVSALALLSNVGLNLAFVAGLDMDVEGLALATALTSWLHLGLLLPGLVRRHGLPHTEAGFASAFARMALAAACCGAVAHYAYASLASHVSIAVALALAIGLGALAFLAVARLAGLREARSLRLRGR